MRFPGKLGGLLAETKAIHNYIKYVFDKGSFKKYIKYISEIEKVRLLKHYFCTNHQ